MKSILKLIPVLAILILAACSSGNDNNPPQQRTFEDIAADFQALDLQEGVNDVSLQNSTGSTWSFRIILPTEDNTDHPLLIVLHGASGGDPNAHKTTACYAEPGFEAINPIIISPNGGNLQWLEPYNQNLVLSLVELAKRYLPVDESKIVVTGYSNGGNGSWFFGETQPSIFSAAIPIASSYSTIGTDGHPRKMPIPMYVIHGEDDELFPVEQTQEWVNESNSAGSNITLEIAPGLSHNEPCEYVPYVKHAAEWLQQVVWD